MSTLILDHRDMSIESLPGRLRLNTPEKGAHDIPIALLERVIIQARVVLDSSVLGMLAGAGIPVLIMSPRRMDRLAIVLGRPHNDLAVRVAQIERATDPSWCDVWSRGLVLRKLRAQQRLAARIGGKRKDLRREVQSLCAHLDRATAAVGDASTRAMLRGIEGAASRASFRLLAAAMPPILEFNGRNRRPPKDPVNAILSLSFTLVHFDAVRSAYMAGLDPYVGFYHCPAFARESLASDLIEPLRPHVEEWTWRLFADRELRHEDFMRDKGACMLGKAARSRYYAAFESWISPVRRALRRECRIIARTLRNQLKMEIDTDGDIGSPTLS